MRYRWDDVAVFLALYREGTTGRAAAMLSRSQPTVVRRLAALEAASGLTLFTRTSSGLEPTAAAHALADAARQFDEAAQRFEEEHGRLCGENALRLRLTTLDHFESLFVPILRGFREAWPNVGIELLASDRLYDLARGEADIAIRGRIAAMEDSVVTRSLPDGAWTLYAPVELPASHRPATLDDAGAYLLALPEGAPRNLPVFRKLAEVAALGAGAIRCSNYNALRSAVVSGTALTVLPITVGDDDARLVRCFDPPPEYDVAIYLLGRRASLDRPQARDLFERIFAHFTDNPVLLTGRA